MFQALNPQYGHYCGAPPQSGARNKPSTLTHFGHFYQIRLLKDEWSQNVKFKKNILKKKKKSSSTEPDKYISVQIHETNPNCQPDLGLLRNQNTSHRTWLESHRHYLALSTFSYKNAILMRQISQCCASGSWLLWSAVHRQAEDWFGTSRPTPQNCKAVIRAYPKTVTAK